ncbi:hypothetical protein BDZ97DRAFT_1830853 [Flammula alnicola]|nr:hypothetical protein BDZ97DRAFT_1830853 [Flammula alnicola]
MAVKDLVQLYEPSFSGTQGTSARRASSQGQPRQAEEVKSSAAAGASNVLELEPPRLARFIKRAEVLDDPFLDSIQASGSQNVISQPSTTSTTTSTTVSAKLYHNEREKSTNRAESSEGSTTLSNPTISPPFEHSTKTLAHSSRTFTTVDDSEERESLVKRHAYPPNTSWSDEHAMTPKSPHRHTRQPHPLHKPVPATVVFSRNAYPLNLPKLDRYLASLSPPFLGGEHGLAKTGLSLDDLENNSTIAPVWRNRSSILGASVNFLIGFLGSSALASFYSLTGLMNTIQIFALILSTIVPMGGLNLADSWRKLLLGTIPNVLALNFAPVMIQSLLFLLVLMTIAAGLLYYFYRSTIQCDRYTSIEGLQQTETKGKQWGLVIVTFLLTVLYLPLCTMSVHVLVWSQELWAVPNPYLNSTISPPLVTPLGPLTEFRDPLDFCWTTTMKRNEVNFAPVAVVLAVVVFVIFAVWFPIALRHVISRSVPKIDKFTELGRGRSSVDLDGEYRRLLDRDRNPFAFLYNDNCLFRSFSRSTIPIAQQTLLLISTLGFFIAQCIYAPFLEPVNNASEWTSRLNYLSTSATALAITLTTSDQVKNILDSYVLYSIYALTYGLSFYFSVISYGWMQNIVKKLTRRIDFSIDIFSPRLDTSSSSIHTKRRIWQESITALLLTDADCAIPKEQAMAFAQARDSEFPPYLLDFMGTPGERHVENLKIFRDVGSVVYNKAVALLTGPDFALYRHLEDVIQKNYLGPDSYWKKPGKGAPRGCSSYFGNAWWIPFPPTLVIRYDDGPYVRRYVRMSLRALEGRIVRWPYEHVRPVGSHANWWCCGRRYNAVTSTHYEYAVLSIKRRGHLTWQGLHLGSGFDIRLKYARDVKLPSEVIGLNEDFDLTSSLARFLEINKQLIDEDLFVIEEKLSQYRRHHRKEFRWKSRVLTYRFLSFVYDRPRDPDGLAQSSIEFERDSRVCHLMAKSDAVFKSAYTRLATVSTSEAATWWYIFWDDLLEKHASDFNPHYRTCIAYTPLPRPALETFLTQRGLLHKKPHWRDFFHAGFLNKLYLRLNDAVFRDSSQAIMFHLGSDRREMDMEDIDVLTQGQPSTLGTGGGTDHDDSGIRMRPAYRWEGLLSDPLLRGHRKGHRKWLGKLGAWLGVTPLWRVGTPSNGISLDVKVEDGRYVLLDDEWMSVSTGARRASVPTP